MLGKLAVIACALLRIYGMALVPSLALGALLGGISGASLVSCIFTALIGVCGMIIIIAPALAVGTLIYNRAISSLVVIASSAILFFLLRTGGYFSYESGTGIPDAVRGLIMPSPLSLSVTALAFVIIFVIGSVALCLSRIKKYDEEELDDNDLMTLGISKEIAIYERSGDRLTVLVSGMALSGEHEALPDMIINEDGSTELLSIDNKGRSRSKKKSARDKK
ncbi:MAG: hypothetical protein RSC55_00240 [Oscillospiraceae bacterium]